MITESFITLMLSIPGYAGDHLHVSLCRIGEHVGFDCRIFVDRQGVSYPLHNGGVWLPLSVLNQLCAALNEIKQQAVIRGLLDLADLEPSRNGRVQ